MDVEEQGLDRVVVSPDRPLSPRARPVPADPEQLENAMRPKRSSISSDVDYQFPAPHPPAQSSSESLRTRSRPFGAGAKRLSTSQRPNIPLNMLPSAPASPPTPAPSPTPFQRVPLWPSGGEHDESFFYTKEHFSTLNDTERVRFLAEILALCNSQQLSFVSQFVSPRLKRDPFRHLPDELCLRVLSFVDEPRSLVRAAQVSHRWHKLASDDMLWKSMCDKYTYRQRTTATGEGKTAVAPPTGAPHSPPPARTAKRAMDGPVVDSPGSVTDPSTTTGDGLSSTARGKRRLLSHYTHFRHRYMIEAAWRKGGESIVKHITPDQGVVTSLHLTDRYIVVAMDNAKIHVFNTVGDHQKTLKGHVMGVWAMVPWDDLLVSGGCDRDVRVWNMATGRSIHTLRGHTSTVRCLKMSDATTAISGSRDTTLRVWDLETGVCKKVLVGHQASVRCLAIHGDLVVSGSYDTTARIWSISDGRCLRTLTGHFSQIYAIAFDGHRVATGSLDTSVRIWDPQTGTCHAVLQGHTSLVGQLQMRGDTLVTGGSDGSVRVWSLQSMSPIHRLAAHDNSVTSLQFDDNRIVSGGSDGRVKIWSVATGQLVRELSAPAEAVWRVAFEEEKAVIMASRNGRTVMEVWSFSPRSRSTFVDDPPPPREAAASAPDVGPHPDTTMHDVFA